MKKLLPFILIPAFLSGCAMTYEAPIEKSKSFNKNHHSSPSDMLVKAKRILVSEGYQIQSFDDKAGIISTSLKNMKLSPDQAACGKTMGLDYLKDNRTKTEVAINIVVDKEFLLVNSNIQGEYKPGAVDQDITLRCVSLGVIEEAIGNKILK